VVLMIMTLALVASGMFVVLKPALNTGGSQVTTEKADILIKAIKTYQQQHSSAAPPSLDDLVNPGTPTCFADKTTTSLTYRTLQGWCGPYVDRVFSGAPSDFKNDGWSTVFQYGSIGPTLKSCGPDRTCGNSDDISFAF
jgi:hypothetical protein